MTDQRPIDMPERVRAKAMSLGVHNDCLVAGPESVCPNCDSSIMLAFDFYYGHLHNIKDKIAAITDDYLTDLQPTEKFS